MASQVTANDDDPLEQKFEHTNWEQLRALSLLPGGFAAQRAHLWPLLLHAESLTKATKAEEKADIELPQKDGLEPWEHSDERQIRLDTERSFVLYPVDPPDDKEGMQDKLHELLVAVFRKRPKLSYFQGYHDIVTVLLLTLPPELQLPCAEKISLHRVRDSMGAGLEPILGLLRILKNLLRLVNPVLASILERNSPLPYYALSNLLTLFSHDMPTLPLIQHVFDYLLCRPPIAIVYLAAAIILSRKEEVERLEEEGEEGMMHSLLTGLSEIYDEELVSQAEDAELDNADIKPEQSNDSIFGFEGEPREDDNFQQPVSIKGELLSEVNQAVPPKFHLETIQGEESSDVGQQKRTAPVDIDFHIMDIKSSSQTETPSLNGKGEIESIHITPPSAELSHPHRAQTSLTSLLIRADDLYKTYPPSHPSISLDSIMGPRSVVFTWSEVPASMPSDDEAEAIVEKSEFIVLPYVDPDLNAEKEKFDNENVNAPKPRKRRKLRKSKRFVMEKRTMVASAVLVLGVAMAVYGIRAHSPHAGDLHGKEWKKVGRWVGGVLVGASEKIFNGFGPLIA